MFFVFWLFHDSIHQGAWPVVGPRDTQLLASVEAHTLSAPAHDYSAANITLNTDNVEIVQLDVHMHYKHVRKGGLKSPNICKNREVILTHVCLLLDGKTSVFPA